MFYSLILNFLLLFYFLLVILEDTFKPANLELSKIRKHINTLSLTDILPIFLLILTIFGLLLTNRIRNPLTLYIYTIFSITLVFHALWISWIIGKKYKTIALLIALITIFLRIFYPSVITHNLFVILVTVWLGSVLSSFKFFTKKLFFIISTLWFLYDIAYIWLTTSYQNVQAAANTAGFPLALLVKNETIGLADLFWASILIAMLPNRKTKIVAALLLIISHIFLEYYVFSTKSITIFPLLVLWVPIGLALMFADRIFKRIKMLL